MAELKDRLRADMIASMKAKQADTTKVLRAVLAAITTEEVAGDAAAELTAEQELAVVTKQARQRRDSAEAYAAGGRQDLADAEVRFVPGEGTPPDLGDVVERRYKPLVMQLASLRVPTIAAVNGIAAGAGASLALVCDMVVATESAAFMLPFAKIGLIPDTACSWIVPQRLGFARAMGLAMTGEKLPATKAAEWGLIWEAVPNDDFAARIDALAAQLAAMPTKALVRTRQAMLTASSHTLEQHLTLEGMLMREMGRSADYVEGVSAFLEKRAPRFTGA